MMSTKVSERLCDRRDVYRRALADPVRFDVAFYAGLYAEELEAEVERLRDREKLGKLRMLVSCLRARVQELEAALGEIRDTTHYKAITDKTDAFRLAHLINQMARAALAAVSVKAESAE